MGFTVLYRFTGGNDGANPQDKLTLSDNTLYGTASGGGYASGGTAFSLSFTPQLTIVQSGTSAILTWPTNVAGFNYTMFRLQCSTNPASPVGWNTVITAPIVVNGQNTVTNPISGAQMFYRLIQ